MFEEYFREQLELAADLLTEDTRDLLRELDIDASGDLIESAHWSVTDDSNLVLSFEEYGEVQDAGLNRGDFRALPAYRNVAPLPFTPGPFVVSAPTITRSGEVIVRVGDIRRWIKDRGIRARGYGVTQESLAYILTRSIRIKGFDARPWIEQATDSEFIADLIGEAHSIATEMTLNETFNIT